MVCLKTLDETWGGSNHVSVPEFMCKLLSRVGGSKPRSIQKHIHSHLFDPCNNIVNGGVCVCSRDTKISILGANGATCNECGQTS